MNLFNWIALFSLSIVTVSQQDKSWVGCYSPQYIELGSQGVIQCRFPSDFQALYWFDNVTVDGAKPTLTYRNSEKEGDGYDRGEFDIFPNGSLIIRKTSLLHDKKLKVICFHVDDLYSQFVITVIVTVSPLQMYPEINGCDATTSFCFQQRDSRFSIACSINGSRPYSVVEWYIFGKEQKNLTSLLNVYQNADASFNTVATLNLSAICERRVALLTCVSFQQHLSKNRKEKQLLLSISNTPSNVTAPDEIQYLMANSVAGLNCSLQGANAVIWGKVNKNDIIETVAFWTRQHRQTMRSFEEFHINDEQSLVISPVKVHHEGKYSCVASGAETETVKSFQTIVVVPPDPRHIILSECLPFTKCTRESDREGELTCEVIGVRPTVTLKWQTEDEGKFEVLEKVLSVEEIFGLFNIVSKLRYKLSPTLQCGEIVPIGCYAHGEATFSFLSAKEVDLHIVNCTTDGSDSTEEESGRSELIWIVIVSVVVFICIVAVVIIVVALKRNSSRRQDTTTTDYDMPLLGRRNLKSLRKQFIKDLRETYEAILGRSTFGMEEYMNKFYIPNDISVIYAIKRNISSQENRPEILASCDELFSRKDYGNKPILIKGHAGQGKTSFFLDIIQNWCKKKWDSKVGKFDIVVMLSLKEINNQEIYQCVREQLLPYDTKISENAIKDILQNEKKYLLLLDGFDQYKHKRDDNSFIHRIFQKKLMRNSKVILTTRPTEYTRPLARNSACFMLESFSAGKISKYIDRFFEDVTAPLKENMKTTLQEDKNVASLCQTPLFLFMTALIVRESKLEGNYVEKITPFFELLILSLNSSLNLEDMRASISKISVSELYSREITKLALDGLNISTNVRERGAHLEIRKTTEVEIMINTGILHEVSLKSTIRSCSQEQLHLFRFSHELFQCFYGAIYLAFHATLDEIDSYLKTIDTTTCQQLFTFTCGLTKKKEVVVKIVEHFFTLKDFYPFPVRNCIVLCLHEAVHEKWSGRMELLNKLRQREHGLLINHMDTRILKAAKASLLTECCQNSMTLNVLALNMVIAEIRKSSIVLDTGASFEIPQRITTCYIADFNENLTDVDLMHLIENTTHIEQILIYSTLTPTYCTNDGIAKIRRLQIAALWITFKGETVVNVSLPSPTFSTWLSYSETVVIKYLTYRHNWSVLSEEERRTKHQVLLSNIKKKGFKEYFKKTKDFTTLQKQVIRRNVKNDLKRIEKLINEWHRMFEAKSKETEEHHWRQLEKHVMEMGKRFEKIATIMQIQEITEEDSSENNKAAPHYTPNDRMKLLSVNFIRLEKLMKI